MTLYKNTFRIETARHKDWDYTNPWWYYITINTKDHVQWFGTISKGEMQLNKIGKIIEEGWLRTINVRNNVDLDYYVIMPNHIHRILIITPDVVETTGSVVSNKILQNTETTHRVVSTTLKPNSLGSIIGQFKSVCSKQIYATGKNNFAWQSRFYDRIIRNEKELLKIRKYILGNPLKWEIEKDNHEYEE
ncbi:MAG: transposase [Bacteroidota bacterium]